MGALYIVEMFPGITKGSIRVVTGTHLYRGYISQYLTIQGERLENRQILDEDEYEGKVLEVHYLPHSKYVVEIWYWD